MRIRTLATLALVGLPSIAFAQRRSRDPLADMANTSSAARDQGAQLTRTNVEDVNPLSFLLEKKGDLKLTDAQVAAIQSARDSLAAKNEPLLAKVEPLAYATRPPNGGAAVEAEQDRMSKARRDLMDVVKQVRENDDAAAKAVVAQLGPDQQKQAEEMLKKQHGDADKAIRKGMGRR